jgi:serine protease Do
MKRLLLVLTVAFVVIFVLSAASILALTPLVPRALAAISQAKVAQTALASVLPQPAQELTPGQAGIQAGQAATQTLDTRPVQVGADLQAALQQVYQTANPSVVSIRVSTAQTTTQNPGGPTPRRSPNNPNNGQGQNQGPSLPNLGDLGKLLPNLPNLIPGLPGNQNSPNTPDLPALPSIPSSGQGSGLVWDTQGNIVTNNHVVEGATRIDVTLADGRSVPATIVGRDPDSDLAVIKVDPKGLDLHPVTLADSGNVKVGQFVVAIGDPFGLANSMTFGIVSALGRSMAAGSDNQALVTGPSYQIPDVIQTDAPINPGNSGGVLLDLNGRVIGVTSAIESPVRGNAGVGFAIPSATVQNVVPSLIETGTFLHPYLGISGATLNPDVAQAMGLNAAQRGALVDSVTPGSPADKAGVRGSSKQVTIDGQSVQAGGDVIVKIDNQPVNTMDNIISYLSRNTKVGEVVSLTVLRDGQQKTLQVTLGSRPGQSSTQPAQPSTSQNSSPGWLGISGLALTAEIAKAMNLPDTQKGALVENVTLGSPADKAGLQGSARSFTTAEGQQIMLGGDVITAVDGKSVSTIQELTQTIQAATAGQKVTLSIVRNGENQDLAVTLVARPAN